MAAAHGGHRHTGPREVPLPAWKEKDSRQSGGRGMTGLKLFSQVTDPLPHPRGHFAVCIFLVPAPLRTKHSRKLLHSLRSHQRHHNRGRITLVPWAPTFVCRQAHTVCSGDAVSEGLGTNGNFLPHQPVWTGIMVFDSSGTR